MRPLVQNVLAAGLMLALWTTPARGETSGQTSAQGWPQRTVRFIIPLPPGSGTDLAARLLAERLTARWRQPVVVENRQGADGIPAVTAFLGARDNHTFLLSFAGVITFNHLLHERLPYDPATDLVPIVPVVDNFLGVSATALLQVNSLSELVRAARGRRGCLTTSCSPCRRAPASRWFRCPTATSRRPTRISIKDGCTSRPPECRRSCRTTRRALPSCCSSPIATVRRRRRMFRPQRRSAIASSPSRARSASTAGATCPQRSRSESRPTSTPLPPILPFARGQSRPVRRRAAARRLSSPPRSRSSAPRLRRSIERPRRSRCSERCASSMERLASTRIVQAREDC